MSFMTTVKELRRIPGTYELDMPDIGQCLVVPENQFKPGWIESLERQGQRCIKKMMNNKAMVLVKLEIGESITVPQAEKVSKKQNSGNPHPIMPWLKDAKLWSPEEDALLIELWKKKLPIKEIYLEVHKKYPERTEFAVSRRIYPLQKKGLIEKRNKSKLKNAVKAINDTPAIKSEKDTTPIETVEPAQPIQPVEPKEAKKAATIEIVIPCVKCGAKLRVIIQEVSP